MGLLSVIGSITGALGFPGAPLFGLVDRLSADDPQQAYYAPPPAPPPPAIPFFSGVGASTLANGNGNYDVWDFEGLTAENYDYSTPPYFPEETVASTAPGTSVNPGVLQQMAGSVLNWLVPSAQASPAVLPGIAAGGAQMAAGIIGRAGTVGAVGAAAGALGRAMTDVVASAIFKLRARLLGLTGQTISASALATWGAKTWTQLTRWVAKNPGTSAITFLTGLGLTVTEAAHFLAWGATKRRRRSSRGVSSAQMRTTRRTIGKLSSMARSLSRLHVLTGYGGHRHRHHHHHKR